MYKSVAVFFILLFSSFAIFGQNLMDYFAITDKVVYTYLTFYTETDKKTTDQVTVSVKERTENRIVVEHTTLFVDLAGMTKTEVFEVYQDKVVLVSSQTVFGKQIHNEIIMKPMGQQWKENTRTSGEYYIYIATPVTVEGNDFLGVGKDIYSRDILRATETNCYSQGIGLRLTLTTDSNNQPVMTRVLVSVDRITS